MIIQDIRLRLVIRRHAVPEVRLVWPCTGSEDLTVAKLLAQINEVVPLESGDWGLEDYAVELADGHGSSFECLHFQPVGKLFKNDDQVMWVTPPTTFAMLVLRADVVVFFAEFDPYSQKTLSDGSSVDDTKSQKMGSTWWMASLLAGHG